MPRLYSLAAVDTDFFDSARFQITHQLDINCSATRMMSALRDAQQWVAWASPMVSADWTSAAGGKDATRDVYLRGGILFKERFFHWQDAQRVSFCVDQANVPGLVRFAEDHKIITIGNNRVRLHFTLAFETGRGARLLAPLVYGLLKRIVPRMLERYKKLLESPA
ncbi:hypothetical protein G8764_11110 [Pseudomaricurvus alcaniphilus]|uniref:SRPBCC family protein n=1 Tax=Pseudomaricurvus alcaniphilus TaxID=1166482 RepID=UPI00140D867C|nr:SRPBCC family protein [Pseudomaricurvus alcaniphilus]NHN37847.1 hypothetical protein [Pseudomaricurvus alcaniphilus]